MANDLTGPVWKIDSTMTYNGPVKIVNISWNEAVTAGDQITLTEISGKPVLDSKAYAANYSQNFGFLGYHQNLKVTKIDSGIIYITVGSGK